MQLPKFWKNTWDDEASVSWHARLRLGKLELGYNLYRHMYFTQDHRWVFQPYVTLDMNK